MAALAYRLPNTISLGELRLESDMTRFICFLWLFSWGSITYAQDVFNRFFLAVKHLTATIRWRIYW